MNPTEITIEDVILETTPFDERLISWCKKHDDFYKALKLIHSHKFLHLGTIVVRYPKNFPKDQVIGVYSYHYSIRKPIFKQDFIVNKNSEYKEFIIYTRNPDGSSKWVKDINEFYKKYDVSDDLFSLHHITFDQLPDEVKERGRRMIALSEKIKSIGHVKLTQNEIDRAYLSITSEKKKINTKLLAVGKKSL